MSWALHIRRPVGHVTVTCWIQETGQCPYGTQCHFAHYTCELVNVDISSNFVTRSIESEDTKSILSTETAVSRYVRSTARLYYCQSGLRAANVMLTAVENIPAAGGSA